MTKHKRIALVLLLVLMVTMLFSTTAFAAGGDVAGAIEGTWNDASGQIKTVVNLSLIHISGSVFEKLTDKPKSLRDEVSEFTRRKKKSYLRR